LVEQIESFFIGCFHITFIYQFGPWLRILKVVEEVLDLWGHKYVVLFNDFFQSFCSSDCSNVFELLNFIFGWREDEILFENHCCKNKADSPNIIGIEISVNSKKGFGRGEGERPSPHIEVLVREVELGKAPVDQNQLLGSRVDEDVVGLHISVHHSFGIGVVKGCQ
jgi:hypothetical protein